MLEQRQAPRAGLILETATLAPDVLRDLAVTTPETDLPTCPLCAGSLHRSKAENCSATALGRRMQQGLAWSGAADLYQIFAATLKKIPRPGLTQ